MMQIALRMARHRLTSLIAVACAVLGGTALITATGVLADSGLRSHAAVGRLAGADIIITAPQSVRAPGAPAAVLAERNRVPATLAADLRDLPGVRRAVGDVAFPATLFATDHRIVALDDPRTSAHGWLSVNLLDRHRTEGAAPVGTEQVALGSRAADAAEASVGGDVTIAAAGGDPRTYRVSAVVHGAGDALYFSDTAVEALRGSSGATSFQQMSQQVDLIGLQVDPQSVDAVEEAVRQDLRGTDLVVSSGADRGDTAAPELAAARGTLLLLAGSMAGIVIMLVGFVVTGAVSVSVAGQRRALALIRSIGGTPRQVRSLVAAETTATAAIATIPGIALGYVLAGQLGHLLRTTGILPDSLPLTFGPVPAVAAIVAMIGVAHVAARAASWRMSRKPVIDAMIESSSEARVPSRNRERVGLLVMLAAGSMSAAPLFIRSEIGAAMTSTAGIVAAIGLAVVSPSLLRRASDAIASRIPAHVSAPTWLAVTNLRVFTGRFAGIITASAMLIIFTVTYALSQTTLLRASADSASSATTGQFRITADQLGGVPVDLAPQVRDLDGVRAAAPVSTTSVVWPHRVLGDTEIETEPAMVLSPAASGVLDLDVRQGSLDGLEGKTIAIGTDLARSRHTGVGQSVRLVLGDGSEVRVRVVAVYARHLGLGSIAVSRDLALGHTTSGLDQSLLVRTNDTTSAGTDLSAFVSSHPGLEVAATGGDSNESIAASGILLNVAMIVVLVGYLGLTIANRIVAVTTQRSGEVAALRSAGATRAQILGTTRREALIAAAVACGAAIVVSIVPLVFLSWGFLGRPWPSGPMWLIPATALLVAGLIMVSVEAPTRYLLRSSTRTPSR